MVQFDLSQMVYDEIIKHVEKVHEWYWMPFPSLIFQVLFKQNPCIFGATEHHEQLMLELKFSHKLLESKYTFNEPEA